MIRFTAALLVVSCVAALPLHSGAASELEGFETAAVLKVEEQTDEQIKAMDEHVQAVVKDVPVPVAAKPIGAEPAKVMRDVVVKAHKAAASTAHVEQDMEKAVNELTSAGKLHPQTLTAAEEKKRARAAAKELMLAKKEANAEENTLTSALNEEKTLSKVSSPGTLHVSNTPASPVKISKSMKKSALIAAKWIEGKRLAAELQKLKRQTDHKPVAKSSTLGDANDKQTEAWQTHTESALNDLRQEVKDMGAQVDMAGFKLNRWYDGKFNKKHAPPHALLGESKELTLQETENKIRQDATASIKAVEERAEAAISAVVEANGVVELKKSTKPEVAKKAASKTAKKKTAKKKTAKKKTAKKTAKKKTAKKKTAKKKTAKKKTAEKKTAKKKADHEPAPEKKASTKPNPGPGFRHMTKTVQQEARLLHREGHKIEQQADMLARSTVAKIG